MSEPARCVDPRFWAGTRVLLTGHTGFKGGWAALWLASMGAEVTGLALPPDTNPSLFALAEVGRGLASRLGDLRVQADVAAAVASADPEIVLHMAAQPLVRASFAAPIDTFATNVMGTAHLLDALRGPRGLRAVLVVTTDKVYANAETGRAFTEADPLGGHDPYAASKAAAELVTASYAASFFDGAGVPVATARGGNVIGGGDFSADRIVPDVFRALSAGTPVALRHPQATRPWQHVLDCVAGYLLHVEALAQRGGLPERHGLRRVRDLVSLGGTVVVETYRDEATDERLRVRFTDEGAPVGPTFRWAHVGRTALVRYAQQLGYSLDETWSSDGRVFVALGRGLVRSLTTETA